MANRQYESIFDKVFMTDEFKGRLENRLFGRPHAVDRERLMDFPYVQEQKTAPGKQPARRLGMAVASVAVAAAIVLTVTLNGLIRNFLFHGGPASSVTSEVPPPTQPTVPEDDTFQRETAIGFLNALTTKNVKELSAYTNPASDGVWSMLDTVQFGTYTLEEGFIKNSTGHYVYTAHIEVLRSKIDAFPSGIHTYAVEISHEVEGIARMDTMLDKYYDDNKVAAFAYNFSFYLSCYETMENFNELLVGPHLGSGEKAYWLMAMLHSMFSFDTPVQAEKIEVALQKQLGLTELDINKFGIIDEWGNVAPLEKGGSWTASHLVSIQTDESTTLYTVTLDFYADFGYIVKAKTMEYVIHETEGVLCMISTKLVYDSSFEVALRSI